MLSAAISARARLSIRREAFGNFRRNLSVPSPSPKIRVAPFLLKPSTALSRLHVLALLVSSSRFQGELVGLIGGLSSKLDSIVRGLGVGGSVQMTTMKAIYWPIWRMDALLEGLVKEDDRGNRVAYITAKAAHMPGHPFASLSHLSFAEPDLPDKLCIYRPTQDLTQLGEGYEITGVPFHISPLGMMEEIRKLIGKRARFHNITIEENRWKEVMTACYPVMFPIYVAEFVHKQSGGDRKFTVVMDAHREDNIYCRASWPHDTANGAGTLYINPSPSIPQSRLIMNKTLFGAKTSFPQYALDRAYTSWLAPAPDQTHIPPSPLAHLEETIDWADPRIQDWCGPDRRRNAEYCDVSSAFWNRTVFLNELSWYKDRMAEGKDPELSVTYTAGEDDSQEGPLQPLSQIMKETRKDVWTLKAKWAALKPKWLMGYEWRTVGATRGWKIRPDGLSSEFPDRLSRRNVRKKGPNGLSSDFPSRLAR